MMVYPDQMPSHPEQFDCYCNPVTQNETYVVADVIMSVMEVRVLKLNCATPVLLRTLCEHHHSTIVPRSLNVLSFPITARIGILAINLSLAQCKMTSNYKQSELGVQHTNLLLTQSTDIISFSRTLNNQFIYIVTYDKMSLKIELKNVLLDCFVYHHWPRQSFTS